MGAKHIFWAFIATLFTLSLIFGMALFAAGHSVTVGEAFGMGTMTGGLIGILTMLARSSGNGNTQADTNLATALDKMNPVTPGLTTPPQEDRPWSA